MTFVRLAQASLLAAAILGLSRGSATAEDVGALNPMAAIDKAAITAFVERPLFDPARRLPPPPPPVVAFTPPPPPAPVEPVPSLQLLGIVHGRHDMAIVHRDGGPKTVILRSGDRLGSWVVTVRPPVGISLRSGGRTAEFAIFAKAGQQSGGAPQALTMNAFLHRHGPGD